MNLTKKYSVITPKRRFESSFSQLLALSPTTLLYFYPKDNTPGCTLEAQDFTRLRSRFDKEGIAIIGVSLDDEKSHKSFLESCGLGIDLVSDDGTLHEEFGVIGEKNLYGKKVTGVIRSTFLVDSTGKVLKEWRNVKATGHAEKVARELGI